MPPFHIHFTGFGGKVNPLPGKDLEKYIPHPHEFTLISRIRVTIPTEERLFGKSESETDSRRGGLFAREIGRIYHSNADGNTGDTHADCHPAAMALLIKDSKLSRPALERMDLP
jgi:hypothetical protein